MSTSKNLIEKVEYRGELRIVGTIYEYYGDKKLDHVGYVVMVEKTRQFKAYTVMQTFALLERFKFINAELATYNGVRNIKCTDSSENRLPIFDTNLNIRDNQGIYILGEIRYDYKKIGFRCMNTSGKVVDLQESQLIHMVESNGTKIINGKYVHKKDSTGYISGISSDFLKIELSKKPDEKSEKLTKEKKWLYEKHTAKWLNKILPGVISYYALGDRSRQLNYKAYCNIGGDRQYKPILAVNRENRVIVKEVLVESNGIKLTDKDKEIIKKYLDKFNEETVNKESWFINNVIHLAQFVLKNKEIKNNIYNKVSRRIKINAYKGYSNPIPVGLLNLADSPDFKDMASSELVKLIGYAKKVAKEYKSDLDEINSIRDKKISLVNSIQTHL